MVGVLEVHGYHAIATPAHAIHGHHTTATLTRTTVCLSKFAIWLTGSFHPVFDWFSSKKGLNQHTHTHTPRNHHFLVRPNSITTESINYTQWCCCSANNMVTQQNTTLKKARSVDAKFFLCCCRNCLSSVAKCDNCDYICSYKGKKLPIRVRKWEIT